VILSDSIVVLSFPIYNISDNIDILDDSKPIISFEDNNILVLPKIATSFTFEFKNILSLFIMI